MNISLEKSLDINQKYILLHIKVARDNSIDDYNGQY